jgi:dolichol-phosphate mannosyltransferase
MRIVIVIPTYNEAENIELLIRALREQFRLIKHEMAILVVDDNSPDETANLVKAIMAKDPNLYLITGEKHGLGAAYIRGMCYALQELKANAVMEMDADFSHKPEDVPRLIAALEAGADFVIGSRYVPGGKIPENWGLRRTLLSRWGNVYARYLGGFSGVKDCTAGFRAIREELLKKIDLGSLAVKGYAFQMTLLYQALRKGGTVVEVPVEFVDRVRGTTKLGFSDMIEFFFNVMRLRVQDSRTFLKFAAVGLSGAFVNLGIFLLITRLGVNKFIASPIAIETSIISNFFLNNYWTFRERNPADRVAIRGLKFKGVSLMALCLSYTTFVVLCLLFPENPPSLAGIIPATLFNYTVNSRWTFKDRPTDLAPKDRLPS